MSFFDLKNLGRFIQNTQKQELDCFDLYLLEIHGFAVNLYISHQKAGNSTHIHCTEGGDIIWEQFYPFGGMSRPSGEKKYALKPICDKNAITVVIIRGIPGNITGLDNGIFKSYLSASEKNNVYLMTEKNSVHFLKSI